MDEDERRYRQDKRIKAKLARQAQERGDDPVAREEMRERIRELMVEWEEATRGMRWADR